MVMHASDDRHEGLKWEARECMHITWIRNGS